MITNTFTHPSNNWMAQRTETGWLVTNGDERYVFKTAEFAAIFAKFCNRIEPTPANGIYLYANGSCITTGSTGYACRSIKIGGLEVATFNSSGELEQVNLPLIVWHWLKFSLLARFMKKIVWGERGR